MGSRLSLVLVCVLAGVASGAEFSPATILMELPYGTGVAEVDTASVAVGSPKTVIGAFRIDDASRLWILTPTTPPEVRCLEISGDSLRVVQRVELPDSVGVFHDFLYSDGVLFGERLLGSRTVFAAFYEFVGDSLMRRGGLPTGLGYNTRGGTILASLGRLQMIGEVLYEVDPVGNNSLEIGNPDLYGTLSVEHVIPGCMSALGSLIQDTMVLRRNEQTVLSMPWGQRGRIADVDEDGGFTVREAEPWHVDDGTLCRSFSHYAANGSLDRRVIVKDMSAGEFVVGGAGPYYHEDGFTYLLLCEADAVRLLRY